MLINYKNISDEMSNGDFNAYACFLANNKVLTDDFEIKDGKITGEYGEYTFDLTNASIVDNGVLITDETLSNDITVLLENPSQYATYTLHLTVLRYGETSLLDEEPETETIDLTLDLVKDTAIVIPMTDLQEYDIILFDSSITVKHDLPEIKGAYVTSLALTTDKLIIQNGQSATVTVTALDLDTLPVANKSIKLYKDGTLLDTLTTDSNGQATKTITATSLAEISLVAKYQGTVTSEELVINDTSLFDLSLTSSKDILQTNETATLTATLTGDDTGLAGETITFEVYHNDTLQETLTGTTDVNGVATASYTGKGSGVLNIKAVHGIIQSETYSIWDTLFYCHGTDIDHNPNWFESAPSTMTVSRSENGTTISKTGSGNVLPSTQPTESSSWSTLLKLNVPLTVEFEIVDGGGLNFRSYNNSIQLIFNNSLSVGLWKFEITSNSAKCYKNGVEQTLTASNFENTVYFAFTSSNSNPYSITFKDFKIYSN